MKKELLIAMQQVQAEIPVIKKNTKAYNYKYADLPTVWNAIKEVIAKNGFVVTHEITKDGVVTTAYHEHGELTSTIPFATDEMKPQEIGSEITYYKRYNLGAIFNLIIEGEDDDAQTAQKKTVIPKEDLGYCDQCHAPKVKSKSTGKVYCGAKCWLNPAPQYHRTPDEEAFAKSLDKIPVINK